ncbi:hypothetical protein HYU21_04570 [Candidatus Woesearchaeota archaeon]|nr:hypothetical protein [Candidatus Woesearchaeota archaeon]
MVSYTFARMGEILENFGFLDFILPFILVFTIVFAVLQKTKILGDKKNFNVVIALVLGLLFVVPHVTGFYVSNLGYDPVQILNETLPSISLVAVAAVMLLILMGIFGADFAKGAAPFIAILAIVFVTYIFGAALKFWNGPWDIFSWWTPETTELMIIVLVFGLIVYFIVKEPNQKTMGSGLMEGLGKLFEKK